MEDLNPTETVRHVLAKPMSDENREYAEMTLGQLDENENNLLTQAVAGMVSAASMGNVSAFNALMALYDAPGAAPAEKPKTPAATVLQLVQEDRAAKAAQAAQVKDKKAATG